MTEEERRAAEEAFFEKKRRQNAGEEAASEAATVRHADGTEERIEMGSVAGAAATGALEGAAEGAAKGAARAVKAGVGALVVDPAIGVAKLAGTAARALGWDGLHKLAETAEQGWANWGADALDHGYEDWGTQLGDIGAKVTEIAGMAASFMGPGALAKAGGAVGKAAKAYNAALPFIFGNAAAVRAYDTATANGQSQARALTEAAANGAIHFLGFKAFQNKTIDKWLKIPEMREDMLPKFLQKGAEAGVKGFEGLVKAVRDGQLRETLARRGAGALKAGGILGAQNFFSSFAEQAAREDVRPVEELSDEELAAAKAKIDAWEAEQAKAAEEGRDPDESLKPEWEMDAGDRLVMALKAGAAGFGEGVFMEGVQGAGEAALTLREARRVTAGAIRSMIATPRGRAFLARQDADALDVVAEIARKGGKASAEQLDAAGLPPDMEMRDVRRLAFDLKRDVEEADRRAAMESEAYRKRAALAERLVEEQKDGETLEFDSEEQKAEAELALRERAERRQEATADAATEAAQGMADTLFGKDAGVLVRRGTQAEAEAAAKGALGAGADAQALKNAAGEVFGYWDRGRNEMVLFRNADHNTVAHELGWHATRQWAERNAPGLLKRMNEYAARCPEEIRKEIEAAYPDFSGDALLDEIGAGRFERELGERFRALMERSPEAKSWWQGLKDAIAEAWRGMVKGLKVKGLKGEGGGIDLKALEGMTPEEGMAWLADRMIEGKGFERLNGEKVKGLKGEGGETDASRGGAEERSVKTVEVKDTGDGTLRFKIERNGKKKTYKRPEEALRDFIAELDGVEMDAEQQGIYDVATGGRKTTDIRKDDLGNLIKLHKGNRGKGAQKIIAVHYAGKRGKVTAKEVIDMGLVIREGELTLDGTPEHPASRRYEMLAEDGARLRVVVDLDKQGNEAVINLYSDRKDGNPGHKASPGAETTSREEPANQAAGATEDGHAALTGEQSRTVLRSPAPGKGSSDGADYSTGGEAAQGGAQIRPSIGGIYTGAAADYANRSRQGGVDDGPSVKKIGTGEGAQVYGWGLYGSTVRGVAEGYAEADKAKRDANLRIGRQSMPPRRVLLDGKPIDFDRYGKNEERSPEAYAAKCIYQSDGDMAKAEEVLSKAEGYVAKAALEWLRNNKERITPPDPTPKAQEQVYEQTFFTNRAAGDESHLLKWYEPVSEEQFGVLRKAGLDVEEKSRTVDGETIRRVQISKDGKLLLQVKDTSEITGEDLYRLVAKSLGSEEAASEFLYRAGIDGVKYPVDSYGGKTLKDGDEAGWNYVAFSDEHIRVDHKWTDGQMRYSRKEVKKEVEDSLKRNAEGRYAKSGSKVIHFAERMPIMDFVGVKMNGIFTTADRVRKMRSKHFLTQDQIASLLEFGEKPAAVFVDIDGNGSNVILTDEYAPPKKGEDPKPIMILLRPDKKKSGGFIASAYSRTAANESAYVSWKEKLRYIDENKIAGLKLEGETVSQLKPQSSGDNVLTKAEYSEWSTSADYSTGGEAAQGGAAERRGTPSPLADARSVGEEGVEVEGLNGEKGEGLKGEGGQSQVRPSRRTAAEEREREERALEAVRAGRVRVADTGGTPGEASEAGQAAGAELAAANGGRGASEAGQAAPSDMPEIGGARAVALSTSQLLGLFRALRGNPNLVRVLKDAKRRGAAWVSRLTKGSDVELNPEAFGIIDASDRERIKAELVAEGNFRHEDPVWNMKHSKRQCDFERETSEMKLEDRLHTLAEDRVRGKAPGGNRVVTNALAHEIGQLLMEMPASERLRTAAGKDGAAAFKDLRTVGEGLVKALRVEWAEGEKVKGLNQKLKQSNNPTIKQSNNQTIEEWDENLPMGAELREAVETVAWWRGVTKDTAAYERIGREQGEAGLKAVEAEENRAKAALARDQEGLARELFGMFLAAPETLRERAPRAFGRIVEAMGANEALLDAYSRIASADAPTEVMSKIREQWTHEAQRDLRELEREIDAPLGTWMQRAKRRLILNLHSTEGAAVSVVDDTLRERVAAAKRAVAAAKRGGDAAEIARAERNLKDVRADAKKQLAELKIGVLRKQRGGGMERRYAENMLTRVFGDIERDGVALDDLRTYMKAKWNIALQGRADSYGLTPQESQKILDGLKRKLGDGGYARLERAQGRFYEVRRKEILDNPEVEAAFGKALVDYWRQNADYVRSERILGKEQAAAYRAARAEWLKRNPGQADVLGDIELMIEMHRVRHGGSDGSVFAKPLAGSFKATGDPLAYTLANDMHILQFARRNALVMQFADLAKELKMEGWKEVADAGLGRALEGSRRYGSVSFMRKGERKLLIMPKVAAEGLKQLPKTDVAGLVAANRYVSAILTQYSPRFALRNVFRNRAGAEINVPWLRESRLVTAARWAGLGPVARLAEALAERAAVRMPDGAFRSRAANLVWGENTTMYWIGEATRLAKLMFDPKGVRNLAERADEAAANGDLAAAQAIMEEIAKVRDLMKKPIFAGQWEMMRGQADRSDLDAVFRALDMRTNLEGTAFAGLRRAARAAKDLADTVKRFNTFEEARIKIVAELAAARARNRAAAQGREFAYSPGEVDYITATMAGSPRYEMRGRWMNVLEAIPLGPFANVSMKGALRTVESMRMDPAAWWGKAAHRIGGRMAEIALWGAGGYALVAAVARRMFGDNEEAQAAIDGFENFGRRMARARACISDYRLRNYDIVPLGLYGQWASFGVNMPRGDEDRLIMPLTDTVAGYLCSNDAAKRAGLHDPIDGRYTLPEAIVGTAMGSGLAPDITRGSMIWNLGKDVLYAWLQNPYNTFTQRPTYGQAVWENRWQGVDGMTEFFKATMKQAWNDVGGQVVMPASTWDEDEGNVPDEGRWVLGMADPKDAVQMPVGGRTVFRALHYVPMASSALSGLFYMNCDGDARIARRLAQMQAGEKAARDHVAMQCLKMQLKDMDVAVDYAPVLDAAIRENGWDEMDRALIEQALVRKLREAAKKMGRANTPILDLLRKPMSGRERETITRYCAGIGWEVE